MRKLFLISIKDFILIFRDKTALIFMLLAPYVLTLGLGVATGSFSASNSSGISNIPLIIVNADQSVLGNTLVQVLQSKDIDALLEPVLMENRAEAVQLVDSEQTTALIYIPEGFTQSMFSQAEANPNQPLQIELYGNPTRPTSVGIIKSILTQFVVQAESVQVGSDVIVNQLLALGTLDSAQIPAIIERVNISLVSEEQSQPSIRIKSSTADDNDVEFNVLGLLAPGMALLFLMYTVTFAGNSLLGEQSNGTLARLFISPTSNVQILGGKILATIMSGVAQLLILILATSLMFQLKWGDPLGVFILVIAAAIAASAWGLLLAAIVKTPGQLATVGSVLALLFGVLSGSFTNITAMPNWVQIISRISPNRWALDGFTSLAMGAGFDALLKPLLGLLVMAFVLYTAALLIFRRRGLGRI